MVVERSALRVGGWIIGLGLLMASAGWGATLRFSPASYHVRETQLGVSVTLEVSAPDCAGDPEVAEGTVTVRSRESSPVSARADEDFDARTYTIPLGGAGRTPITRVLEGLLIDDPQSEGNETFLLTLESAPSQVTCSGGGTVPLTIDPAGATVIINDSEDAPPPPPQEIRFERDGFTVEEPGSVDIAVVRSSTAGSVAVDWTAGSGEVSPSSGTITFPEGSGRQQVRIQAPDDPDFDDETVRLELSNPRVISGGVQVRLGSPAQVTLTIRDDDTPTPPEPPEDDLAKTGAPVTSAQPGQVVELKVKASNANGPRRGVTVRWEIEGPASFVDGPTSQTGENGIAAKSVSIRSDARSAVKVSATLEGSQKKVEFDLAVVDRPLGDSQPADSGAASVGQSIDELCSDPAQARTNPLCTYFFQDLSPAQQDEALEELDGDELGGTETLAIGGVGDQMKNLGSRLAALRGGASRQPVQHLAIQIQGKPVNPGTIAAVVAARDSSAALKAAVDRELASLDDPQDDQEEPAQPDVQALPRLGVFLSGRVSFGEQEDRSAQGGEAGFDLDTRGLTAGVDYRLSNSLFLGAAAGMLTTNTDLSHDGGSLDAQGESLSVFGLFQPGESLYFQGTLTYGTSDYDMTRNLDMPVIGIKSARADTGGTQLAAGFDVGLDRHWGAHTLSGVARGSYVRADLDGYRERGADQFNIEVTAQEIKSLQSELGLEWAYTGQLNWGLLRPMLRFSYLHEYEADARLIRGRFLVDPDPDNFFSIPTNEPDRDFFNGGLTLMAQTLHGSIFLSYDQELGRSDVTTGTVTLGLRQDF